jgi:hypothetical protein
MTKFLGKFLLFLLLLSAVTFSSEDEAISGLQVELASNG